MQKSKVKNQKDYLNNLKVALVVEELTQLGGAERILDIIQEMFPKAPVYTLIWDKNKTLHHYDKFDIRPSFIQKLPFGIKKYKWFLPIMPKAIESFDFKGFDVIISITSALVKGVKTTKKQLHICYCNTPTRYLWIDYKSYIENAPIPFFVRPFMPVILWFLRRWDLNAAKRPDFYIANSKNVQARIKKYYHRDSKVLYPMIDINKFNPASINGDYYLLVSRIEPYKKVDLVIKAFKGLNKKLMIVGMGTRKEKIEREAPKNVDFFGRMSDEQLADIYSHAKAVIFPQEEDFGLVPIEAMAAGKPVIAYQKGGALETVIPGITGEFFYPQTVSALRNRIKKFNPHRYNSNKIRDFAKKFDKTLFKRQFKEYIISKLKIKNKK